MDEELSRWVSRRTRPIQMLLTKNLLNLLSGVFLFLASSELAKGNECTPGLYEKLQNVSMCDLGTHVIPGAYLSASSAEMGEGTRCTCTLVALSPASQGSYFALNQNPRVSNCSAFVTVRGSSQAKYTCLSTDINSQVLMNASDVTIKVLRNGSVDFGFCVIIADALSKRTTFNLTCERDGIATSQPTESSATAHTSSPTSSWPISSSSSTAEPSASSTSPLPTSTTYDSTVQTSTLLPTSVSAPASPAQQSVIPVAAGIAGGLVFLIVVIIIVVIVCIRRTRQPKENPQPPRPEVKVCNGDFSDVHLEDNVLYESSSAWTAREAPKTGGATQPVEGGAGGGGTSGQTSGHLGQGQYLGPAGDVYSLVQKAGEDGGPGHLQSAQLRSTPGLVSTEVLQGGADDQSDEDDLRLQYNGGEEGNHSVGEDMTSTSLRSSSLTPGLRYVDVELARDQDGRTEKVSSKDDNATTEYTIIDHDATKNKTTEL